MRLPRKGILIRIVIYGVLLAIVLPPAVKRFFAERPAPEKIVAPPDDLEGLQKKTIVGPDGKTMDYYELTPEEFEQRFGRPPPSEVGPAPTPGDKAEPTKAETAEQPPTEKASGDAKADLVESPSAPDPVEAGN